MTNMAAGAKQGRPASSALPPAPCRQRPLSLSLARERQASHDACGQQNATPRLVDTPERAELASAPKLSRPGGGQESFNVTSLHAQIHTTSRHVLIANDPFLSWHWSWLWLQRHDHHLRQLLASTAISTLPRPLSTANAQPRPQPPRSPFAVPSPSPTARHGRCPLRSPAIALVPPAIVPPAIIPPCTPHAAR
ncbi:hypothetical protein TCAP_03631 [Tolypocladium capitatum]|uniref:Uncharacterized protein n=1 Tax=Tolypocladium capitatum TaxID=45235 RepID=A0A2K3QG11_9HYPO|nr:hypothetical protein TCAP_03631 [Tolypocladium capitatum]